MAWGATARPSVLCAYDVRFPKTLPSRSSHGTWSVLRYSWGEGTVDLLTGNTLWLQRSGPQNKQWLNKSNVSLVALIISRPFLTLLDWPVCLSLCSQANHRGHLRYSQYVRVIHTHQVIFSKMHLSSCDSDAF